MKKNLLNIISIILLFFCISCSGLSDLSDPGSKADPIGINSFASLQELANQAFAEGKVPLYSTLGKKSGLITTGDATGCVVMVNGSLKCWGLNDHSQLGDGSTTNRPSPIWAVNVNPSAGDIIVAVVAGRTSTCAFYYSGLKCWGNRAAGVLGDGLTSPDATSPVTVTKANGKTIKYIQLNDGFTCFQDTSGSIYCWGTNTSGQLGNGSTTSTTSAVTVSLSGASKQFIAQNHDSCAILQSNALQCWGANFSSASPYTPVTITTSGTPVQLGGGTVNTNYVGCVILADTSVQCFGNITNSGGELGNGTTSAASSSTTAVTVLNASTNQPLKGVNMVGTGGATTGVTSFACAVADDFINVYCWGTNDRGQLGNGSTTNASKATLVTKTWPNSEIVDLSVGDALVCLLLKNNDVWCWGGGMYGNGELGNGVLAGNSKTAIKILNRNDQ